MITIEEFRKDLVQSLNIAAGDISTALAFRKATMSEQQKINLARCMERFRVLAGIYEVVVGEEWPADEDRAG